LNRSVKKGVPGLFPDLKGKAFNFLKFIMIWAVGCHTWILLFWEKLFVYLIWWDYLLMELHWIFSNVFAASVEMIVCFLSFVMVWVWNVPYRLMWWMLTESFCSTQMEFIFRGGVTPPVISNPSGCLQAVVVEDSRQRQSARGLYC
jgi:hypothetical protein